MRQGGKGEVAKKIGGYRQSVRSVGEENIESVPSPITPHRYRHASRFPILDHTRVALAKKKKTGRRLFKISSVPSPCAPASLFYFFGAGSWF